MFGLASAWIQFAVCLVLIGWGGVKLSHYGDVIAEKTGMGGTWIGLILMATVTSLPELVTGVSAVGFANTPDIAVGDVLGSCVFNLLIIVVLDFLYRKESVYTRASQGHVLSAGFGVLLIGFAGFNMLLSANGNMPSFWHVGVYTPIIILIYAVAMRTVFRYEREHMSAAVEGAAERYPGLTLKQASLRYAGAAGMVVAAALWLPFVGKTIATLMEWHESFVGTLFVAFATSVPELAVTIGALRIGAIDMAIGNVLGSNLFDILILAIDDILYLPGPLLSHTSQSHAVTALSAMMMTGVAIIGLLYRPKARVFKTVGWASLFLFSLYLLNTYVIYLYAN
ncbi:sodium:calcium antiporter [Sulfurirhabdus autotrophica]|uniref:Cation:H+ antiporter n=1 Tax=Sulfurirhabdus autotrophica TaxID=1706046 RepID=A0A4V2W1H0_9PROT|nr:sodium:calcium antiporter [Sulfurirhabdus autotrophica]TCV84099.1 cation:H+ antiporter [Sulfurirhabdus autotrophica]